MFQVGDKVRNRYLFDAPFTGTVCAVNGKWIHVKHDAKRSGPHSAEPDRFDYCADELEHVNVLLRISQEI